MSHCGKNTNFVSVCPDIIIVPTAPSDKSDMENCLVFPLGCSNHSIKDMTQGQDKMEAIITN